MPTVSEHFDGNLTWGEEPIKVHYNHDWLRRRPFTSLLLERADRPDSNDPTRTISGSLYMRAQRGWPGPEDDVDFDTALTTVVTALVVDALHELSEYLEMDGDRVFDPHPPDEDRLWATLGSIAHSAARKMVARHPRLTSERKESMVAG